MTIQPCIRPEVPVETCQVEELELKEQEGESPDMIGSVHPFESAHLAGGRKEGREEGGGGRKEGRGRGGRKGGEGEGGREGKGRGREEGRGRGGKREGGEGEGRGR